MYTKDWKKQIFSIPNLLSFFRILLIPVYIAIYLNAEKTTDYYIAGCILAISCLTDLVDGWIARRFNMVTTLGKVLDPLADKLTQFAEKMYAPKEPEKELQAQNQQEAQKDEQTLQKNEPTASMQ